MKIKKIMACLLAAVLLLPCFAGCGGENNSQPGSAAPTPASSAPESSSQASEPDVQEDPVHLVWLMVGNEHRQDTDRVFEKISEITLEKINATVETQVIPWGEYVNKMQFKLASKEDVDIFFTASWIAGLEYSAMAQKNALYAIDDLLSSVPKLQETVPELLWEASKVHGSIYGVPTYKAMGNQMAVSIPTEVVERNELDLSNVKTIYDVVPLLEKVMTDEQITVPFLPRAQSAVDYTDGLYAVSGSTPGAVLASDPEVIVNQYETEEYKKYCTLLHDFYVKQFIPNEIVDNHNAELQNKEVALYMTSGGPTFKDQMFSNTGYEWTVVPITEKTVSNESATGAINCITSFCKNPEKALQFLELLNTDQEIKDLVTYGIEGEHYTRNEDGSIHQTNTELYMLDNYMSGNIFIASPLETEDPDRETLFRNYDSDAKATPLLGFNFATDKVTNEIAACNDVIQEYAPLLESGQLDPEEALPKFIEALKNAGSQAIIDEMQVQYNEFLESN